MRWRSRECLRGRLRAEGVGMRSECVRGSGWPMVGRPRHSARRGLRLGHCNTPDSRSLAGAASCEALSCKCWEAGHACNARASCAYKGSACTASREHACQPPPMRTGMRAHIPCPAPHLAHGEARQASHRRRRGKRCQIGGAAHVEQGEVRRGGAHIDLNLPRCVFSSLIPFLQPPPVAALSSPIRQQQQLDAYVFHAPDDARRGIHPKRPACAATEVRDYRLTTQLAVPADSRLCGDRALPVDARRSAC
jgi:hypothetical protein